MSTADSLWYAAPENDYRGLADWPLRAPPTATVVIPVYNRTDLLDTTLTGFHSQGGDFSVIVADDGSDEDVGAVVAAHSSALGIEVVRRDHAGYGAGQARNLGVSRATGDVMIFVDADCIPGPGFVTAHLDWHRRADNVVVIGSRRHVDRAAVAGEDPASIDLSALAGPDDARQDDDLPDDFRRIFYRRTAGLRLGDEAFRSLVSSNFSVRRARFLECGGFSVDFTRWGGEDTELGWRLFNDGLVFVPENVATVYHQVEPDDDPHWRRESRRRNDGLLQTKIPHRFYRTPRRGFVYEVPKVSIVVAPTAGNRIAELWDQLLRQSLTDLEMIVLDDGADEDLAGFLELTAADRRVSSVAAPTLAAGMGRAMAEARGEYVAVLHGWAAVDHRLLGRAVRRLDGRPRAGIVQCGYQVRSPTGPMRYLAPADIAGIDAAWNDYLPVFALTRTREWSKLRHTLGEPEKWWPALTAASRREWLADALVAVPGAAPPAEAPRRVPAVTGDRTLLYEDLLRSGPRAAAASTLRYVASRVRRRPYRPRDVEWSPPAPGAETPRVAEATYVGWVGKENMGDEAMLQAIRELLPGMTIDPDVAHPTLLILGGGTLINRSFYLDWLLRKDSPRLERVVLGTGVADPVFWRRAERTTEWVDFVETCAFVGVRGPRSVATLRTWGYRGPIEVVGDPALALERPDVPTVPGRVVLSPAWTNGELWGGDDRPVLAAFADATNSLLAAGREVVFLSAFPGDDRHIFQVMRDAGRPELPFLAGYDDLTGALELIASAELVVAERLHSAVLAAACTTPFVLLEYRPKARDFAASLGLERLVTRTDAVEAGLGSPITHIDADAEALREEIATSAGNLRRRLHDAAARIGELVSG